MDNLLKITISARSELRIPFEVKEDQSKICWYFTCSSGDIDFAILHNGEEVNLKILIIGISPWQKKYLSLVYFINILGMAMF